MNRSSVRASTEKILEDYDLLLNDLHRLYDDVAKAWVRDQPQVRDDLITWPLLVEKTKDLAAGGTVVDIGCGTGNICRLVSPYVRAVLGIDISKNMLAEAEKLSTPCSNVHYVHGDMTAMGGIVAPVSTDLVISVFAYCCLKDKRELNAAFAESRRVLKSGGFLLAQIPHPFEPFLSDASKWARDVNVPKSYFDEGSLIRRKLKTVGGEDIVVGRYHFTLETYFKAFAKNRFVVREVSEPRPSASLVSKYPDLAHEINFPSSLVFVLQT